MNKNLKTIVSIILIVVFTPLVVGIGVSLPIFKYIVINNDWIGFWGSYVGTILGGMITLYVLWNTITDNENARKRDEKLNFFDKVTELSSNLQAAVANIFVLSTRLMAAHDNELYRLYLEQINNASGIGAEINILLVSRSEVYDCEVFLKSFSEVVEQINKINDMFEHGLDIRFTNKTEVEKIDYEIDITLKKITDLQERLIECIKKNLY